ncbi:LysE family transporter [Candidatus Bathyarchaeota archaeon]|nr:LysE family transporter [Candidatus Bathyarchaeota archaeon]
MAINQLIFLAVASFIVGFSGALVPGPVFVATVVESARRGYLAGPLITIGHAMAEAIIIFALYFGLSFLIGSVIAKVVIGIVGGSFLIWMGYSLIKSARKASLQLLASDSHTTLARHGPIITGILTSVSNPYFFLWWATIGNDFTFRGIEIAGLLGIVIFALSHWMSDLSWYTLVAASIHKGRKLMSTKIYKSILAICGFFIIFLGLVFIFEGLRSIV